MTNEAIEKLPQDVRKHLEEYNEIITTRSNPFKEEYKHRLQGYLWALKDAGIVTEVEKRNLYIYYVDRRVKNEK